MRQNLKVLTISIMLLGRIHFNMVLLTAHNYAQLVYKDTKGSCYLLKLDVIVEVGVDDI